MHGVRSAGAVPTKICFCVRRVEMAAVLRSPASGPPPPGGRPRYFQQLLATLRVPLRVYVHYAGRPLAPFQVAPGSSHRPDGHAVGIPSCRNSACPRQEVAKAPGLPACLSLSRFAHPPSLRLPTTNSSSFCSFCSSDPPAPLRPPAPRSQPSPARTSPPTHPTHRPQTPVHARHPNLPNRTRRTRQTAEEKKEKREKGRARKEKKVRESERFCATGLSPGSPISNLES